MSLKIYFFMKWRTLSEKENAIYCNKTQEKKLTFQYGKNIGKTLGKQWKIIGNSLVKPMLEKEIHLPTLERHFMVFQGW